MECTQMQAILYKYEKKLNHNLQCLLQEIYSELETRDVEIAVEGDEQMISIDKFELSFDNDFGVIVLNSLK